MTPEKTGMDVKRRVVAYPASVRGLVRMLFEEGRGYKFISTRTGIPQETVRSWYLDWTAGCFKPQMPVRRTRYPAELRLKAIELSQSGRSLTQISRELGISRNTVQKWIVRNKGDSAPKIPAGALDQKSDIRLE